MAVANRPVAEQETTQVDREDAAAVQRSGRGKNHDPAAQRQQRVKPGRQHNAINHLQQQIAAAETDSDTQAELLHDMHRKHPAQAGLMLLNHLDKGDGQEHRHRVVAAGFNFQRRADAFIQSFTAEQREHRRGISRADDSADQQPFNQVEMKQPGRHQSGQGRGDQHPDRGERQRGPQRHAKGAGLSAHPAVKQDNRQRQVAHHVGERVIVKRNAADTVNPRQHPNGEEDNQDRDAEA